ncbi:NUDIX domain-containing protein [Actinospica sp. MGRD01-02]|uniref:NUDIX domain-containing protein n=1 Tax=Actinospica acidithermotolerans TaxID=2828514 RepID=A0A941EDK9_9ACTN|nr:NUDIX domain-containing protein [Actinospica acidithermotolerans]MBR7825844.1 NUDIX domain-containing protein [Actinospica acidithermotolerans]
MNTHAAAHIDHVGLNLPERDFAFWQEMFRHLGFEIRPDGNHFDAVGAVTVCVTATKPGFEQAGFHRRNTGLGHLAVRVESPAAVDAFVAEFLRPRGIEPLYGGPAGYDYEPGYYAVYFEDRSRLKVEVMTSRASAGATGGEGAPGAVRHQTASVFVVRHAPEGWQVLLIWHERLGALTIPGGHVEQERYETPADAAVRETREEAGLDVVLVAPPTPRLPEGYPHQVLAAPWWTVSGPASPDGKCAIRHVHIDLEFLAVPLGAAHGDGECEPHWLGAAQLASREDCLPDTRMHAVMILEALDHIDGPLEPAELASTLHSALTETF